MRFGWVMGGMAALCASAALAATAPESGTGTPARLAEYMDRAAAEGFRGAVIVVEKGKTLLEAAYGVADAATGAPLRTDSVFPIGSITKQFTAAAILKLQETGRLKLSDPITRFFPDVPEDKHGITLHQLLSHQAGFPGAIGDDLERIGRDDYVRRALATPLEFPPGGGYDYSNVGYSLAAAVVEIVSGQGYEAFLREHLFGPAGMVDTGYHLPAWKPERLAHGFTEDGGDWGTLVDRALSNGGPGWNLLGNGGLHSTLADMARWHRALLGNDLLSAASKELMFTAHADEGDGISYGYGWTVRTSPWGRLVKHNGGNGVFFADFLRYLDRDVMVFYATTSRDRRMYRLGFPLAEIVFTGKVPEFEPAPTPLVPVGQGPAAPEGSAAARWRLPGTVQGERAAEFLDALKSDDPAARTAFVRERYAPGLVERNGLDRILQLFTRLREDAGDLRVEGLRPRGASGVDIVIATGHPPGPLQVLLDLEPDEPHRITRVEVRVGD